MSVLDPAGAPASFIGSLWWLMLWVTAVVFLLVLCFVFAATVRGMRSARRPAMPAVSQRALTRTVAGATAVSVVLLAVLLVASIVTGRATEASPAANAVTLDIIGHQWWWEIVYEASPPSDRVVTANDVHIPVGRPVIVKVESRDVIHSFWVPNLIGKRDLIPGYKTSVWLQAARPGIFRGQCAEFCGLQHAHMAITVIAEPDADFRAWLARMRDPASTPDTPQAERGHAVFMNARCPACHTIRGTDAAGTTAPDLTHIAARSSLASGTLPNTPDQLASWIHDPQMAKPGNQMPANPMPAADLSALVDYLTELR